MKTVYETLKRLGVENKTIITAFNKVDKIEDLSLCKDEAADKVVCISAKHGDYLPDLLDIIEQVMLEQKVLMDEVLPYDMAGIIQDIRKYGQLLVEEYVQDGIRVKAYVPKELDSKIKHRRNGQ